MSRLLIVFLFATLFGLTTISAFAQGITFVTDQNTTYLDENYKPATAAYYTYKRVIKYKEPILVQVWTWDIYGNANIHGRATGYHNCTVTDYYRTGEIALVGNMTATDENCAQLTGRNGRFVAYYKTGIVKRTEHWKYDKLEGTLTYHDEKGNETKREEYISGNRLDDSKFSASANSPIIGTWKYVLNNIYGRPLRTVTLVYSQNGVVESNIQEGSSTSTVKGNWR